MGSAREGIEIQIIIVAMIVVILLSVGVILFFIVYQRRLLAQFKEQEKMRADYQVELLKASITSQEDERGRISRDLHDNIGAMLTTTKIYFQQVSKDLSSIELQELKGKMNQLLQSMIESTRSISQNLSPIVLTKLGLAEAIRSLFETVNDSGRMQCELKSDSTISLSPAHELNVYRIIQELIANSLKHSQSSKVLVEMINENGLLKITYEDNGGGFNLAEITHKKGIGLKNIESRLTVMNGEIVYDQSSEGIRVRFSIPEELAA